MYRRIPLLAAILWLFLTAAQAAEESPIFDIPRLDKITIDGKADDWGKNGFRVDLLTPVGVAVKPKSDHDVRCRLGWNAQGLLVLVRVEDNTWLEASSTLPSASLSRPIGQCSRTIRSPCTKSLSCTLLLKWASIHCTPNRFSSVASNRYDCAAPTIAARRPPDFKYSFAIVMK